jgi:secondary thiamine-phosphate synthase enzyme
MKIETTEFDIESDRRFEIRNVSPEVQASVEELGAEDGLVYLNTPHTSAALATNEYEEKLCNDMVDKFKEIAAPDAGYYHDLDHIAAGEQPNAHAHLLSALLDTPVLLRLHDRELSLGTWEEVMFYELCGPRERTIEVTALTDKQF